MRDIEQQHGPYWRRCAESLFAEQIAASPATTDVTVLRKPPKAFIAPASPTRHSPPSTAPCAKSRAAGQDAKAFELGYSAAAIEQERKRYGEAADRLRQVAIATPALPKSAEAHLLGVYDLGQLARSGDADVLARYVTMLKEHLATWPKSPTIDRARHLWLWRVYEHNRDWKQAIGQFAAVQPQAEVAAEALTGLGGLPPGIAGRTARQTSRLRPRPQPP